MLMQTLYFLFILLRFSAMRFSYFNNNSLLEQTGSSMMSITTEGLTKKIWTRFSMPWIRTTSPGHPGGHHSASEETWNRWQSRNLAAHSSTSVPTSLWVWLKPYYILTWEAFWVSSRSHATSFRAPRTSQSLWWSPNTYTSISELNLLSRSCLPKAISRSWALPISLFLLSLGTFASIYWNLRRWSLVLEAGISMFWFLVVLIIIHLCTTDFWDFYVDFILFKQLKNINV